MDAKRALRSSPNKVVRIRAAPSMMSAWIRSIAHSLLLPFSRRSHCPVCALCFLACPVESSRLSPFVPTALAPSFHSPHPGRSIQRKPDSHPATLAPASTHTPVFAVISTFRLSTISLKKNGTCTLRSLPPTSSPRAARTRTLVPRESRGQILMASRRMMRQSAADWERSEVGAEGASGLTGETVRGGVGREGRDGEEEEEEGEREGGEEGGSVGARCRYDVAEEVCRYRRWGEGGGVARGRRERYASLGPATADDWRRMWNILMARS